MRGDFLRYCSLWLGWKAAINMPTAQPHPDCTSLTSALLIWLSFPHHHISQRTDGKHETLQAEHVSIQEFHVLTQQKPSETRERLVPEEAETLRPAFTLSFILGHGSGET